MSKYSLFALTKAVLEPPKPWVYGAFGWFYSGFMVILPRQVLLVVTVFFTNIFAPNCEVLLPQSRSDMLKK